ncbi:MAG TPA: GvpL/GvpF family gas vesicle protein [Ktedonobacteraceae bacterium]|jgi:hypothetical protein|nr:GvpL/GvpF family gas vesicle protein [Ktedonobacteraceae bacterium]
MNNGYGHYIYGILAANERQEFGPIGIGGRGDVVYTLPYQGVAAIISNSPIIKYPVTRDNAIAHAKVLETLVAKSTILPVRFCTISTDEEIIIEKVLKARYQEFLHLLAEMQGKIELGVRARWTDLEAIFAELVEENKDIKAIKERLLSESNVQVQYAGKIKLGQMVQNALLEKRKKEAGELLDMLRPLSLACKENQFYGDMNLINAAFLVDREQERAFDEKIQELEKSYNGRKQLKYTSPVIPYNFVEVVINW